AGTLRVGLAVALSLLLAGWILDLASGSHAEPAVALGKLTTHLPLGLRLGALGVLALAVTPASRVLLLLYLWTRERDWRFAAVAATVAAILVAAVLLGAA
ncbi:MAG TPA: DUF1634 domain-containing protein, partial [Polyangiaceae bacterium]